MVISASTSIVGGSSTLVRLRASRVDLVNHSATLLTRGELTETERNIDEIRSASKMGC